jgi:hypothetical protein
MFREGLLLGCALVTTACAFGVVSCASLNGLDTGAADGSADHSVSDDATAVEAAADASPEADAVTGIEAGADSGASVDATTDTGVVLDATAEADATHYGPADSSSPDAKDAATDASSDAGTWCSQQSPTPTFCSDFDTPPLGTGWTGTNATNGTVTLDTTQFVTGPSSLLATTSAFAASGTGQAVLYKTLTPSGPTIHFELQLSLAAIDPKAQVVGAELVVLSPTSTDLYRYSLVITATGSEIQEEFAGDAGNVYKTTSLGTMFATGTFYPVQIDLVLPSAGGAAPTGTVHVGGNLLINQAPLFNGGAQGNLQIEVGAQVYPSVAIGACQTNVDNVLLNVGP